MTVRQFNNGDTGCWDEYVLSTPGASCYHLSGWKNVVEKSFGHKTYYLLYEEGNRILGVLPLVHQKSFLFGNHIISLPYFNYGGVCAETQEISECLLKEAINIADRVMADHIELRDTRFMENGWVVKSKKVSMRLGLPEESEELWKGFPSKLRSQVKKPQKDGLWSRIGGEEELESFFKVFSINMRDLGTPVYSKSFFKNIFDQFHDSSRICTVFHGKEPVASGFLLGFKKMLEIPWASSIRTYNSMSPNMLLYWEALKYACENGFRTFDFGRSTPSEGTYRFKEQWGAKPVPLHWYYWLKDSRAMPEINPRNPKYRLAIEIWKKIPIRIAEILGPSIVKNLP